MLILRQLSDQTSSTFTYLLADRASGEALLIDPVFEQAGRDAALLHDLKLQLILTVDTHVHADQVTAAWLHRQRQGSHIAVSALSGAEGADRYLAHGETIVFGYRHLKVRATPGHTNGCMTFVLDDFSLAFSGDCLLVRGTGRTDFQQGNPHTLYRSVHSQIFTLPPTCLVYPAHDYQGRHVSTIAQEKQRNPRLGQDRSFADFVKIMAALELPYPTFIDYAVPGNRQCGVCPENLLAELHVYCDQMTASPQG